MAMTPEQLKYWQEGASMPNVENEEESARWEAAKSERDDDLGLAGRVKRETEALLAEHKAANEPTEIELIGQMAVAMEQIPEEGRVAALRYLMDRYGGVSGYPGPRSL